MVNRKRSFSLSRVHPDQVDTIISNLTKTSVFGVYQIEYSIIKLITPEIVTAVTHILNFSISSGIFLKIIPLHKKDDPLNP